MYSFYQSYFLTPSPSLKLVSVVLGFVLLCDANKKRIRANRIEFCCILLLLETNLHLKYLSFEPWNIVKNRTRNTFEVQVSVLNNHHSCGRIVYRNTLLCAVINSALLWSAHLLHIIALSRTRIPDLRYGSSAHWPIALLLSFRTQQASGDLCEHWVKAVCDLQPQP